MNSRILLIATPAILGAALLVISQIDILLVEANIFSPRTVLNWESILMLSGMLSGAVVVLYGAICLFKKEWMMSLHCFISPFAFLILLALGGALGGLYFNAT